jgi:hypothetical protein
MEWKRGAKVPLLLFDYSKKLWLRKSNNKFVKKRKKGQRINQKKGQRIWGQDTMFYRSGLFSPDCKKSLKTTSANEQFGKMAGVIRPKFCLTL